MRRIFNFYYQAWRASVESSIGRKLWWMLLLKVAILLVAFKVLFFPNKLSDYTSDADKAQAVRSSLVDKYERTTTNR